MKKFFIPTIVFSLLTAFDMILTFLGTPDLKHEGNPISAVMGFGWIGLFLANVFSIVMCGIFSYIAFEKYRPPKIAAKSFPQFYLMLFYNTPHMIVKPMMKFPKNWMPFFAMISSSACVSLIAGRMVNVLEWIAVLAGYKKSFYFTVRKCVPLGRFDIWVFVIAFLISTLVWMQLQYSKSKNQRRL